MQSRRSRAKMKSKVEGRQVQGCSMSSISKLQFGATLWAVRDCFGVGFLRS